MKTEKELNSQKVTQDKTIKLYLNEIGDMTIKADMSNNARYTLGYIIKQIVKLEQNKAISNFAEKIKKVGEENDWDVMVEDGEDGDITISFSEWIDKLVEEQSSGDKK